MVGVLELLPAVDVADGQAVQLVQGVAESGSRYGDPLVAAHRWQAAGSQWVHLVDLDAAFGRGSNAALLATIVEQLAIRVELSGGIRDDRSLETALSTGCARVTIGTAALENPDWCEQVVDQYGDRIAVGLDVRGHTLAARGWTRELGDLFEALRRLDEAGCRRYVVTDIERDGLRQGPNLGLLERVCAQTSAPVIASGGVTSLSDIAALSALTPNGVEGAIIGTAIYSGDLDLEQALALARCAGPDPDPSF
jgi:phosphoribosyl isomerase A